MKEYKHHSELKQLTNNYNNVKWKKWQNYGMEVKGFELNVGMKSCCLGEKELERNSGPDLAQNSTLNQVCLWIIVAGAQSMLGEVTGS